MAINPALLTGVWAEIKKSHGDDIAQDVALILLDRDDITEPLYYARQKASLLAKGITAEDRIEDKEAAAREGKRVRKRTRRQGPLPEDWQGPPVSPSPESILLWKEDFQEREALVPMAVKYAILGDGQHAVCHFDQDHYAEGLCNTCYKRQRRAS